MSDPTLAAQAQGTAMRKLSNRPVGCAPGCIDLSLAGLLCGNPVFVPPPGVARVHRLADDESGVNRLDSGEASGNPG